MVLLHSIKKLPIAHCGAPIELQVDKDLPAKQWALRNAQWAMESSAACD
jgi:hypothetical protein